MTTFIIKTFLIPGSKWLLLLGLSAGVLFLYGSSTRGRLARRWLTTLAVAYWLLSLPFVADRLAGGLVLNHGDEALSAATAGAAAIVVLGAGIEFHVHDGFHVTVPVEQTALNAFEAARLYRLRPVPIIASGGRGDSRLGRSTESQVLQELLVRLGVSPDDILQESSSATTYQQALNVSPLLKARHWERFALITAPVHLLRAAASFRSQGVQPIPVVAPFRSDEVGRPRSRWMPTGGAWKTSEVAIYDYAGWLYYWLNGLLG